MNLAAARSAHIQIAIAIAALGAALDVPAGSVQTTRPLAWDVQPDGYYRLAKIEDFRQELLAETDNPLAQRFAADMPDFWFCQDGEEHVTLTAAQERLQDFNCNNVTFTHTFVFGADLWKTYGEAIVRDVDPTTGEFQDRRLLSGGKAVGVLASDKPARGPRYPATVNPKAADAGKVARAAYAHFVLTNRPNAGPMPGEWSGRPPAG